MERVLETVKVSVIISVKNAEEKIERCLDSVRHQSYKDIEILIVDAGSGDSSMEIARKAAEEDPRIRILESSSENIYCSYNVGIDFCTGNYVMFVDAIDYLEPDTIQICVDNLKRKPSQIVCFGYNVINEHGKVDQEVLPKLTIDFFRGEAVQSEFLPRLVCIDPDKGMKTRMAMTSHCAMFSTDLINRDDWQFDTESCSDILSLLKLYKDVSLVGIVDQALYNFTEADTPMVCRKDFQTVKTNFEKEVALCRKVGYSNKVEKALRYYFILCAFDILHETKHSELPSKLRRQQLKSILEDSLLQKCIGQTQNDEMDQDIRLKFHKIQKKQRHALRRVAATVNAE